MGQEVAHTRTWPSMFSEPLSGPPDTGDKRAQAGGLAACLHSGSAEEPHFPQWSEGTEASSRGWEQMFLHWANLY